MNHPVGARVRTLINLTSATWAPEQPDIPAGASAPWTPCSPTARTRPMSSATA